MYVVLFGAWFAIAGYVLYLGGVRRRRGFKPAGLAMLLFGVGVLVAMAAAGPIPSVQYVLEINDV